MSRISKFGLAAASALCLTMTAACGSSPTEGASGGGGDDDSLVIVSWGGVFTEATKLYLAEPFEKETGIDVTIVDNQGTQVAQLMAQRKADNIQWDILDGMGAGDAYALDAEGLYEHTTAEQKATYVEEMGADAVTDFGVAFANVGFVIACREQVEKCPETVQEFWDTENFPGTRALPGAMPSPLTSILAQAAGVELPADVDVLLDPLKELKPAVKVFYTTGDQQEQLLRQGEVDMAIVYNGRAYSLQDEGVNITINWGGTYDPGYTGMVADAPHPEAAREFMDWLVTHPEAQAKWAEHINYSVAHPEALALLPEDVASRFPDYPENKAKLGVQDFAWYVENKKEIDAGLNQVIQGG